MKTVIVTDCKYRASVAAVRAFGKAGYNVIAVQTKNDCKNTPPSFTSCYVSESHWLEGSVKDESYRERLLAFLSKYDRPVLFCVGAASLNVVAESREAFERACDFLISSPKALDSLNDKAQVHSRCLELGIPVPRQYGGEPEKYPVIVKPRCGEKLGLTAADRYAVANNKDELQKHLARMKAYDSEPLVQEKITGDGIGVSLLLDKNSRLISAICHRRIREYPINGGPSTCCESFYDEKLIEKAYNLLSSFGFEGIAMVEFKGDCVLEVNPRVWGSFPLTACCDSPYCESYAKAAAGEAVAYIPQDYKVGVKMRFSLNDGVALLSYLLHGRLGVFAKGIKDIFTAQDALSDKTDKKPFRRYLRQNILGR